jgi:hypothetical protein
MSTRTSAKPLRLARRIASGIRSLRPAASIAIVLALLAGGTALGGTGMAAAAAAAGRALILGRSNAETGTARLSDSSGTPLSLSAPKNKAPLAVNRKIMVKNLNAQYLGGLSASSVKFTGGDGFTAPNADVALEHNTGVQVAGTGPLPAGTYYVTATAMIDLTVGDFEGQCSIFTNHDFAGAAGGGDGTNFVQAAESLTIQLKNGSTLQEYCDVSGTGDGSEAINGSIIAIRILASSGTKPST